MERCRATKCVCARRPQARSQSRIRKAFTRAYHTIKVDPKKYMEHLRMAYGLPAITYDGVFGVEVVTREEALLAGCYDTAVAPERRSD